MSLMQKRKGARGELAFCKAMGEYLGASITRELGAARDGGPDVILDQCWAVEVKVADRPRLNEWWSQACEQADQRNLYPVLAWKPPRQPWQVLVRLDLLLWGQPQWDAPCTLNFCASLSLAGFATLIRETVHYRPEP